MPKLTGPCMNLEARGTLARILTFVKTARGPVCRKRPVPTDTKTPPQLLRRHMFRFLQNQWSLIAGLDQLTWKPPAFQKNVSPINAYTAKNLNRWDTFRTPSSSLPIAEAGAPALVITWSITQIGQRLRYAINVVLIRHNWGVVLYLSPTSMPAVDQTNTLRVIPLNIPGTTYYWHIPTWTGMHYARLSYFTYNGYRYDEPTQKSAIVS